MRLNDTRTVRGRQGKARKGQEEYLHLRCTFAVSVCPEVAGAFSPFALWRKEQRQFGTRAWPIYLVDLHVRSRTLIQLCISELRSVMVEVGG